MKNKIYIILIALFSSLAFGFAVSGQTITQLQQWLPSGNFLIPRSSTINVGTTTTTYYGNGSHLSGITGGGGTTTINGLPSSAFTFVGAGGLTVGTTSPGTITLTQAASAGSFTTTTLNGMSSTTYTFVAGAGLTFATSAPSNLTFTNNGVLSINGATGTITGLNLYNTTTSINGLTGAITGLNIYNTTTSINGLTGAITGLNIYNTTTSINGLTGAISGLNIYNTTTTLSGLTGGIAFATSTTNNNWSISTSSPTITFNFPRNLDLLRTLATTTGNIIIGSGATTGWLSVSGANLFNTTTSVNGLTGAITGLNIYNTTTSINGLTGTITGLNIYNTTTSINGLTGAITGLNIYNSTTTASAPLIMTGANMTWNGLIGAPSATLYSFTPIAASSTSAGDYEAFIQNMSLGASSTAGITFANSSTTATNFFGWLGINGYGYSQTPWGSQTKHDVTLYSSDGNLELTAGTSTGKIYLKNGTTTDSGIRLTVDNAGNVGIGTTTPKSGLHVALGAGSLFASSSAASSTIVIQSTLNQSTSTLSIKNSTGTEIFGIVATSTANISSLFQIKGVHVVATGTTPTVASCGTSPSVIGTDMAGIVTVGSVAASTCTLTFASQWTNPPSCVWNAGTAVAAQTTVTTSSTLVMAGTSIVSDTIYYQCFGLEP